MQRFNATLVGGNVLRTPGGACDQAHRRTISRREVAHSADEDG
jgi:hypothetical protein